MARPLRVEFPGACYRAHVSSVGRWCSGCDRSILLRFGIAFRTPRSWKLRPRAPVSACHQSGESPLHVHASSVKSNVTASPRGGVESNGRRTIGP
jgi:hypothetical protein